jgi:hypothetical protein
MRRRRLHIWRSASYPISYVEMGEEADGQYMLPEDYAALYLQWATAIHRVDPKLKLGGPSFQGVNKDIEVWPDANGKVSWTARFVDYLKQHGRMNDLAFFSFEHYPYDPCRTPWGVLYDEPELVSHIMQVWHEDGIPTDMPMFITEGNLSSGASETYQDIFAGVWLADYIGSFLNSGGKGVYFFHYLPLQMEPGCNSSPGTFGMFTIDCRVSDPAAAGAVLRSAVNQPGLGAARNGGASGVCREERRTEDGAGHELVTAYAVKRPDGRWAVMTVNRDQQNAYRGATLRLRERRRKGARSPDWWRFPLSAAPNINGIRRRRDLWRTRKTPENVRLCPPPRAGRIPMARSRTQHKMQPKTRRTICRPRRWS